MSSEIKFVPLTEKDIERVLWTGGPRHIEYLAEYMRNETYENSVIVPEVFGAEIDGKIVAICVIDYDRSPGKGHITMLHVSEELRSQGIGSQFIEFMENVIREHGIDAIELWVETNNDRAKELYERLGFAVTNKLPHQWEQDMPDGSVELYKTTVYEMRKALN